MKLNRVEKWGGSATALLAIIALGAYFHPIVSAVGIATNDSVNNKVAIGVSSIKSELNDWRRDDTEMWINYLDSKANHSEADDSDMVLLEAKLRQREELLKK